MKRILTILAAVAVMAAACKPAKEEVKPGPSADPVTVSDDPSAEPSEEPEMLVYTFTQKKLELIESVSATITLSGQKTGKDFKAQEDISLPFTIEGEAAVAVKSEAKAFVVKAGSNTATVVFTLDPEKAEELASDQAVVKINRPEGILPGDIAQLKLKVHSGVQLPSSLVGRWVFEEIFDQETQELFAMEDGYDTDLFPFNNAGFSLIFSEDEETGEVTVTPSSEGDFAWYYRQATVTLTAPINLAGTGEVVGAFTSSEANMYVQEGGYSDPLIYTHYMLSLVNCKFDKTEEALGAGVIAVSWIDENTIIIIIKNYDLAPFLDQDGASVWYDGENFDSEILGFASLFKKVTEEE